jgi:type II secretory ATPase GspE/PulE/Tfp pilus assembly ATPase PilB-like protein
MGGEGVWSRIWQRVVQDEFAAANSEEILFRECIDTLILEVASKESKKLFLVGPTSSGKSISLAAVVSKMRSLNWLVTPIP